jgi:cation diffusion facilitator family transporter
LMPDPDKGGYKLLMLKRSVIAISTVVFVEVILGLVVHSLAIISDGLHATLDVFTTLVLFIAARASLKPPDEEHMYGHEKFESIGGLAGGITLVLVAALIMYEAIMKVVQRGTIIFGLEYVGWVAIGYTFCVDFYRVGTLIEARDSKSPTMKVGFYHAFADLSSTIIALLGFGLATLGFTEGDALASMVLSVLLFYLSVKLVSESGMELSDAISRDVAERVKKVILSTEGVRRCVDLRIRKAGDKTFVGATVQVPEYLGFAEAHDLTSKIEANIKGALGNADVTIHTEPLETEIPTEKLIEKSALETRGVKGVHEIDTTYTNGKLYITLHIYVDSRLLVEEADDIAETIEDKIEKRIAGIENITIHIEPLDTEERRGLLVKEEEIGRIISETIQSWPEVIRIKRIVTYVAGEKRYINIDCAFTKHTSVEDAHVIATEIEEKVKTRLAETIVTIHTESD